MANDTPALCIPPNPNVSGWWWLVSDIWPYKNIFFWCNISQGWSTSQNFNASPQYLAQLGYRIRGPVPSYAEVEKLRSTNAALNKELFTLADKNKALHDRIAKLEAVLQIIKDECRMEMHTPHEAPFTLAYTRDLASEALELDAT